MSIWQLDFRMLAIYTKLRVKSLVEKLPSGLIFDNFFLDQVVPGGGFEPPTRGFSVHCSTPELPGHVRQNVVGAKYVW